MIALRVVARRGAVHDTVLVYAGPDADHRALCGTLTMRRAETEALWRFMTGAWEGVRLGSALESLGVDDPIEVSVSEPGESVTDLLPGPVDDPRHAPREWRP